MLTPLEAKKAKRKRNRNMHLHIKIFNLYAKYLGMSARAHHAKEVSAKSNAGVLIMT